MRYNSLIWIGIVIVILTPLSPWLLAPFLSTRIEGVDSAINTSTLGTVGDLLGGSMTPFLTLASFLMLIATVLMQKEELKLQREELAATRGEFKEQNNTLTIQRFENTFFHMLSLHNEITNSIEVNDGNEILKGRAYFKRVFEFLEDCYDVAGHQPDEYQKIVAAYKKFYYDHDHQNIVGHYFRNLYRIIKLIDNTQGLDFKDKKEYAGIVKAQLSSYELCMLLYNSISEYGREKALPLMQKYNLLDNLEKSLLIREDHYDIFLKNDLK